MPTECSCGDEFSEDDRRELLSPPWMECLASGSPDGRVLTVRCPSGADWTIDGRASNCNRPDDSEHDCWCRHGEPPNLTVKQAEPGRSTHSAGAGSIQAGGWHGFLRRGELVE